MLLCVVIFLELIFAMTGSIFEFSVAIGLVFFLLVVIILHLTSFLSESFCMSLSMVLLIYPLATAILLLIIFIFSNLSLYLANL